MTVQTMSKIKTIVTRTLIALGGVVLIASLGATAVSYQMNRELAKRNQEQATKISSLDVSVKDLNKRLSTRDDELKGLRDQLAIVQPQVDTLKNNMDAFATQAAACDTVRRSLKGGA
ncbi:hypothetical protein [Burkholderia pseudomallei]|uniref:Uncharacterized protein n=2 Tax=Burkholderiaceae TaxID=119060 RepID=A0A0C5B4H8_BURPE|nr:hypothetical protein [Burkholderia pseudomallei]AJL34946.1 hypothetical protein pBPS063 [Burkholderia pseudomallei]KWK68760.1 hypothetical protein WM15_06050 [Burkholderia ubonensis]